MRVDKTLSEIQKICDKKRKMLDLSVTQDILTLLLSNIKIIKNDQIIFCCSKDDSIEKSIFKFFKILGREFQPKIILDEDHFFENYIPTNHVSLSKFLVKKFEEEELICSILKSFNQSVVGLCLKLMKSTLIKDKLNLKIHHKGQWEIQIKIETDQRGEIQHISTIHSRQESILDDLESIDFNIKWELISKFNLKNYDITEIELNLKELELFNKKVHEKANRIRYLFENCMENIDHSFNTKRSFFSNCFLFTLYLIIGMFFPLKYKFGKEILVKYMKKKKIDIWDKFYFFSPSIWDIIHYPYFLFNYVVESFNSFE
jgi:hypothetical protein